MPTPAPNGRARLTAPPFPCWLDVDLDAVGENVRALQAMAGPSTRIVAVVKAEAYGLGSVEIAQAALTAGATWLAVARVAEGVRLRRAGIEAPILNLAYMAPGETATLLEHNITPTVADLQTARALFEALPSGKSCAIHLKVDTGLSRFGAQPAELKQLLDFLVQAKTLRVEGLCSHFATADEADRSYAQEQLRSFFAAQRVVEASGQRPRLRHVANSAAALSLPEARLDLVRLGITLSGHYPSDQVPATAPLRPAVAFKAHLARVYDLPPGASVGYGRTFVSNRPMRAAVVPVGYADGLPRSHSNRGEVLIRGQRVPLVGRVSMDQCVVDLTELREACPGDEVVLFGRQGAAQIDLHEFAAWGDTIAHEALCRIGPRVPRRYLAGGAFRRVHWIDRPTATPCCASPS
jgi:alanine racemase